MSNTVYVVSSFNEGSGGFNWYWTLADALEGYEAEVNVWKDWPTTVRLVEVQVESVPARDDSAARAALTDEIDGRLDEIEVTLPAIRSIQTGR